MSFTESQVSIGDISLNFAENGSGPVLLLVHGFPLDHSMWTNQLAMLADKHRVIAPDLRGFGKSAGTEGKVSMADYADDLAALLAALEIEEPVTLCGLSMGGYIAFEFFARQRAKLNRLILCDTRSAADSSEAAAGRKKLAKNILAEGAEQLAQDMLPKLFAPATFDNQLDLIEATRRVIADTDPQAIASAALGMAERTDFTGRLSQFDLPVLLICGQHDAITPVAEMQAVAAALPQSQFVEIPAAGHMAPLENAAAVNDAMKAFLSQ